MLICGGNGEDGADLVGEDGSRHRRHRAPAGYERWRSLTEDGSKGWMVDLKTRKGFWIGEDPDEEETGRVAALGSGWDSLGSRVRLIYIR